MERKTYGASLRLSVCVVAVVFALGSWYLFRGPPGIGDLEPLPPVSASPFLNTSPQATYVGAQSCAECHPDEHDSYSRTGHSQALSDVDVSGEPPDGEFEHPPSGRRYRIYRKEGQLWHRESIRTSAGEELMLAEFPMRYAIGSGRFSRSYLVEREGFLVQSPVTWYAARPGWAISPGYDQYNTGFERPIVSECLNCHVGRMEQVEGALQRFHIHSQAIDCERCHGPGSRHVGRRNEETTAARESDAESLDLTIVHPGRLTRREKEAICAQCHLHSAATVEIRGRRLSDFRPGLLLNDFCIYYGLKTPDTAMQVVGHVEQMRLSPCYQGSDSLTCTTCHNPHAKPNPEESPKFFKGRCLTCHSNASCGLTHDERVQRDAQDNCVTCHMPKEPTDIPHFAFTHHRIGVHKPEQSDRAHKSVSTLVPLDDVSHLPKLEQERCLGLGYLELASKEKNAENASLYRSRAASLLEKVRRLGLRDPEVDAALAQMYWRRDAEKTIEYAEGVLGSKNPSPESRATALFTLGSTYLDRNRPDLATGYLEQLVRIRLYSEAWFLLSICRQRAGDIDRALEAADRAAQISPHLPQLQEHLAKLHEDAGNRRRAEQHRHRARQLTQNSLLPSKKRSR